jgi:hypothetical protein
MHTHKNGNNLLRLNQMIVDINNIYKTLSCQKLHVFSHTWNVDLIQIQQYYEKHVTQMTGGGKRRKLRK